MAAVLKKRSENQEVYKDGMEQLIDEFKLLDLKITLRLAEQRIKQGENQFNSFKGLVVSEEEVITLLNGYPDAGKDIKELAQIKEKIKRLESQVSRRRRSSIEKGVFLPLPYLSYAFGLSVFEEQCVVLCLAVELDRKYEKLYAYLQDDVTNKNPTVDLALKMLCSDEEQKTHALLSFTARGSLNRYLLKNADDSISRVPMLSRELKLEERIISFLLYPGEIDDSLKPYAEVVFPSEEIEPLILGQELQERLRGFVESDYYNENREKKKVIFHFWGPDGAGKKLQVKHLCRSYQRTLLIIDLKRTVLLEKPFSDLIRSIAREVILNRTDVCFSSLDALIQQTGETKEGVFPEAGTYNQRMLHELLEAVKDLPGTVFLLSNAPIKQPDLKEGFFFLDIEFTVPSELERKRIWEYYGGQHRFKEQIDWGAMAGKFRFTPGQIKNALTTAENNAGWQMPGDAAIEVEGLHQACFAQGKHNLEQRAVKVIPRYTWDDLILPPEIKQQLKDACNHIKYRHIVYDQWGFGSKLTAGKGLIMLFSGEPGTGKTMSAQVIANYLNLELYKIDLAQVVSKYIGETEKNLHNIFHEAQSSNAILFFDEADALFGKRSEVKDAHDRYANIETAYLLQKVEEYDGISILATNLVKNMDDAFRRRIHFLIEYPFPDAEYRERIWRSMFPPDTPVSSDVDYGFIAEKLKIAGGSIKNIVLTAAFLAAESSEPVGMKHIARAARYELNKIGIATLKKDLEDLIV